MSEFSSFKAAFDDSVIMTIEVMEIMKMQGETDQIDIKLANASLQEDLEARLS